MPQDEFIRTILAVSESLTELERSRVLLDCFWDRVCNFKITGLSDEQNNELENLFFILETYDEISRNNLNELGQSIAESMTMIERMRQEKVFGN